MLLRAAWPTKMTDNATNKMEGITKDNQDLEDSKMINEMVDYKSSG